MANRARLTKSRVEALEAPASGYRIVWDTILACFGVRVVPSGAKTYLVQRRVQGRTRRISLGRHGVLHPEQARNKARQLLVDMSFGDDPAEVSQHDRFSRITPIEALESLIEARQLAEKTVIGYRRLLKSEVALGGWASRPIPSITREMVYKRYREIAERSPAEANYAFRCLRSVINHYKAAYRDESGVPPIVENPVQVLSDMRAWIKLRGRNTYVQLKDVGAWYATAQTIAEDSALAAVARAGADFVSLLLLTGLRKSNVAALTLENLGLDDDPPWLYLDRTKNGSRLTLPLSAEAARILRRRREEAEQLGTRWVFPGRLVGESSQPKGHIQDARSSLTRIAERSGIVTCPHDLRRTFSRVAREVRVYPDHIRLLLGHQLSDVTSVHYSETEDLRYLREEVECIGQWIAQAAEGAVRSAA